MRALRARGALAYTCTNGCEWRASHAWVHLTEVREHHVETDGD